MRGNGGSTKSTEEELGIRARLLYQVWVWKERFTDIVLGDAIVENNSIDTLIRECSKIKTYEHLEKWISLFERICLEEFERQEFEDELKELTDLHGEALEKVLLVAAVTPPMEPMPRSHVEQLEKAAQFYSLKRQHFLAAFVFLRLAERPSSDEESNPSLEERRQYLSNAVIQAKRAADADGLSSPDADRLLELLEEKHVIINFQITIEAELEAMASTLDASLDPFLPSPGEAANELSLNLKSITQLYYQYAVPFELWEICLKLLYFSSDPRSWLVEKTWAKLFKHALSSGGIPEACAVLKRVASQVYLADGTVLPLHTLCLKLVEAAFLDQIVSRDSDKKENVSRCESFGNNEIPQAFLDICNGDAEHVLNSYDQLFADLQKTNHSILTSPEFMLHLLLSVVFVLEQLARLISPEQAADINQGIRDKIINAENRYMTEVVPRLPESQSEAAFLAFRRLEVELRNEQQLENQLPGENWKDRSMKRLVMCLCLARRKE